MIAAIAQGEMRRARTKGSGFSSNGSEGAGSRSDRAATGIRSKGYPKRFR